MVRPINIYNNTDRYSVSCNSLKLDEKINVELETEIIDDL